MKKTIALLALLCTIFSCDSSEDIETIPEPTSIEGFLTRKVAGNESSTIISSKSALQQALPDAYTMYLDKVDFSKNNLLLIYGTCTSGVAEIEKKQAMSGDKFFFEINVYKNLLCVMEPWCVAYVVPKDLSEADINVQINYYDAEWGM